MPNVGGKDISTNEAAVVGAGLLVFILSFFHWFTYDLVTTSAHRAAWHSGFFAWAGVLLLLLAAGIVAARRFSPLDLSAAPVPLDLAVLGAAALGALFLILKLLIGYRVHSLGQTYHFSRSFGLYAALVIGLVETVFAYLTLTTSGGKLSDFRPGPRSAPPAG